MCCKVIANNEIAGAWGYHCRDYLEIFLDGGDIPAEWLSPVYECIYLGITSCSGGVSDRQATDIWSFCLSKLHRVPNISIVDMWIRHERTRNCPLHQFVDVACRKGLLPTTYGEIFRRIAADDRLDFLFDSDSLGISDQSRNRTG